MKTKSMKQLPKKEFRNVIDKAIELTFKKSLLPHDYKSEMRNLFIEFRKKEALNRKLKHA